MKDFAIGVFDSGIGGLTCVRELNSLMPRENIIYFGDTARIPYGTRSKETVKKYAVQDIEFINSHNVKMIIAACGTVSSVLFREKIFENLTGGVPFIGVLMPAVQAACAATVSGIIGVIGTSATIRTGAYDEAVRNIRSDIKVICNPCPLFVPMVENGFTGRGNQVVKLVVKQYLEPLKKERADVIILGCTHYPVLAEAIADFLGDGVTLISPGKEAAKQAFLLLKDLDMLSVREEKGRNTYYVSDDAELFAENARAYLGEEISGGVSEVDIETADLKAGHGGRAGRFVG
jgi:glutamate racemase